MDVSGITEEYEQIAMHALSILKQACLEALETEGERGDPGKFFSIVDPGSVLELIQIAESSITDEEVIGPAEFI